MRDVGPCWKCKCEVWIPDALYEAAQKTKHDSRPIGFYCSYGHHAVFVAGETDEQKLRRERDQLAQRIAQKDDYIREVSEAREAAERRAAAARGQVTKLKKRAGAGVCPCCNRTFLALQKHMTQKHPEFIAENVVPLKVRA